MEFTRNWGLDAERRDLTVNSMFLGFDGKVYDFFGGQKDLEARRVAFVGDPEKRIREDYLRILRYFRFYGRLARNPDEHEEKTMKAIEANVQGLQMISGERIWMELKKILSGNHVEAVVKRMMETGLKEELGLPQTLNYEEMTRVNSRAKDNGTAPLSPPTLLASLLEHRQDLLNAHTRLKMSGLERDTALFVMEHRNLSDANLKLCKCWWVDSKTKSSSNVKSIIEEVIRYHGNAGLLQDFQAEEFPRLPIGGKDLKEAGCPPGPPIGTLMEKLKEEWKESDFSMDKDQLMALIPTLLDQVIEECRGKKRKKSK